MVPFAIDFSMGRKKGLKRIIKILWLTWILCHQLVLSSNPYTINKTNDLQFENITSIEGLSNNTVYDIDQDVEGFIWIATQQGLNKFDGRTLYSYYQDFQYDSLAGNTIRTILCSSWGELFVGTESGASIYLKEKDKFLTILHDSSSLGRITDFIELTSGKVLIGSTTGMYFIDKKHTIEKISNVYVRYLCEVKKDTIWATYRKGILVIDNRGKLIKVYNNDNYNKNDIDFSAENIQCIFRDSRDRIWVGKMHYGLGYYNDEKDEFIPIRLNKGINSIEDNFIRAINEDSQGNLWIGTESGLYIYNVKEQSFNFYGISYNPNYKGLNDKAIYCIFHGSEDIIWIGTFFGGVNFTHSQQEGIHRLYADGGIKSLSGNAVSEMVELSDGRIWIATEDGGINVLDPENGTFEYIKNIRGDSKSLSSNNVHSIKEDKNGDLWIGTFIGGLNKYQRNTGVFECIDLPYPDHNSLRSIFSVHIDSKDRIWVAAINGLYMSNNFGKTFKRIAPEIFINMFLYYVEEDSEHNIWVCSYDRGIYKLDTLLTVTSYSTDNTPGISNNGIIYFFEDSNRTIWFGTREGGLIKYDPETARFTSYTEADGLPNNTVYAITQDKLGNIWLSTNKGISMFNPVNERFKNYNENDGLIGNQFNYKSCLTASDGTIYFGAVNGLNYFDPVYLSVKKYRPKLHFTDFKLFNKSLAIGEKDILSKHINYQDKIELKYRFNAITIEYIGLNYSYPKNVEYAYYLEGFDQGWNYVGTKNSATYTNLSPGKYTFKLKVATTTDWISSSDIRTLHITIKPPFWSSIWGYILYFIILISLFLLYIRYNRLRSKEKLNIKIALLEKQKNQELTQHKLNFFTYISHEFKTPLTIVIATIEEFMELKDVLPRIKEYGILIKKNALRLLFLINQLMDFRKIESDHASLKYNKVEIISYIRNIFKTFFPLFERKKIEGIFSSNTESYEVYFDADKLEKIITNLVSNAYNAFKNEGRVHLDVKIHERIKLTASEGEDIKQGELVVSIKDNGPGIPQAKLEHIFDPFSSVSDSIGFRSGIGLALVKSLVNLLNGTILIESTVGEGTSITFNVPLIYHPSPELVHDNIDSVQERSHFLVDNILFEEENQDIIAHLGQDDEIFKKYEILIVEDNKDLSSFLIQYFSKVFKTVHANNGKKALNIVRKAQPDLIISDIMMPEMDGLELCLALKGSIETCHIPIILLTAKSRIESKLEGLNKGADAYVSKPFNMRELDLTVRNILRIRENIKLQFAKQGLINETISILGNRDQNFLSNLTKIIHEQIDNPDFNVDAFCKKLMISRSSLHLKLKKITGLSTTEYIRTIRLNKAKQILETGNYTVSEVAYKVGFEEPTYFSKSFKKFFSINPSQVVSKKGS